MKDKTYKDFFTWGIILYGTEKYYDKAIECFENSINLNPNNSEAYRLIGDCLDN